MLLSLMLVHWGGAVPQETTFNTVQTAADYSHSETFEMKKFAIAITILLTAALSANAQVTGVVGAGGGITISTNGNSTGGGGESIGMVGLDVASASGSLVPYDPPAAPVHTPFLFFLSNTESSIVMASVPAPATVEDDTIVVGYTGDGGDLTLSYGDANSQQVSFPSAPAVPEPATGLMAAVAALGLLGFRRRR